MRPRDRLGLAQGHIQTVLGFVPSPPCVFLIILKCFLLLLLHLRCELRRPSLVLMPWEAATNANTRPQVDAGGSRPLWDSAQAEFCPDWFHAVACDVFLPRSILERAEMRSPSVETRVEPGCTCKHHNLPSPPGACRTMSFMFVVSPPTI